MKFSATSPALFFVFTGEPLASLARLAMRHGWPLERVTRPAEAMRHTRCRRPEAIVVQVAFPPGEELDLIQQIHSGPLNVLLIAATVLHDPWIESAVRTAGAHCYFAADDQVHLIESAIMERLGQDQPSAKAISRV